MPKFKWWGAASGWFKVCLLASARAHPMDDAFRGAYGALESMRAWHLAEMEKYPGIRGSYGMTVWGIEYCIGVLKGGMPHRYSSRRRALSAIWRIFVLDVLGLGSPKAARRPVPFLVGDLSGKTTRAPENPSTKK